MIIPCINSLKLNFKQICLRGGSMVECLSVKGSRFENYTRVVNVSKTVEFPLCTSHL